MRAYGGPNAVGRAGDIVLENEEVTFVIDQLGSSAGFAESGGNLVDAADARVRQDELGMLFTTMPFLSSKIRLRRTTVASLIKIWGS